MIQPILPIAGVPDELLRVVNDRLRELAANVGTGTGTGVPGPPGPPGAPGLPGEDGAPGTGGGTGTAPPDVLSTSTAAVYYEPSSHQQLFGFQGRINLPTAHPNFAGHFKRVDVIAIGPDKAGHVIASFKGAALTSVLFVDYQGTAGIRKIDPATDEVWSVAFQPYSEAGVPSAAPYTVSSLVVYAAKVGTLAAMPVPGTYYQDKDQGLHFEVQIDVTLLHQTTETEVAIWLDFNKGEGWIQQNSVRVPAGVLSLRIGQPISGASGQSRPGDIWVPAPGQGNWKAAVYPGYSPGTTTLPPGTVTALFSPVVPSVGVCFPDDLTNAEFLVDPLSQTGDRCIYAATDNGWVWKYYKLRVTLPTIAKDPWFWHCFVSVQKGHKTTGTCSITGGTTLTKTAGAEDFTAAMVGWALHVGTASERTIAAFTSANQVTLNAAVPNGTGQSFELWNHAPDYEGVDEHPDLYLGRWHRSSPQAPFGISSDAVATIDFPSENIDFTYPLAKNPDQSTNLDRDFRFRLYAVSHANDNIPSTGAPAVPFAYQVIAFKGADHFDLTPSLLPAIHDATQINEKTLGAGLAGGSGLLPFINADPLSPLYADLAGLHFRAASGVIVENPPGSGHYELAKTIIDLAQSVNFDTTNFKIAAGAFLVNAIAVNSLIAGDALFAGQATFAYKVGAVEGGKVTISSGGLTIASTITNPVATLAVNATGLSFVRDIYTGTTFIGRNRLDLTSSGITVQSQNAALAPTAQIIINTGPPASIQIVTNGSSIGITSNGITIADAFGSRVDLDTTNGVRLSNGGNVAQVLATGIKLTDNFGGTLTMDSPNGIKLVRGANSVLIESTGITLQNGTTGGSVKITSSSVDILKGSFSTVSADYTVNINNTVGFKLASPSSFFQVFALASFGGGGVVAAVTDGTNGVNMRVSTIPAPNSSTQGQIQLIGTGSNSTIGTGCNIVIFAGKGVGGPPPASATGYIAAQVDGVPVRIPYY